MSEYTLKGDELAEYLDRLLYSVSRGEAVSFENVPNVAVFWRGKRTRKTSLLNIFVDENGERFATHAANYATHPEMRKTERPYTAREKVSPVSQMAVLIFEADDEDIDPAEEAALEFSSGDARMSDDGAAPEAALIDSEPSAEDETDLDTSDYSEDEDDSEDPTGVFEDDDWDGLFDGEDLSFMADEDDDEDDEDALVGYRPRSVRFDDENE